MKNWIRIDLIKDYLKDNNMSKVEFCRRVGISIGVLNKILTNKLNFRTDALIKIARQIKTNTIFYY